MGGSKVEAEKSKRRAGRVTENRAAAAVSAVCGQVAQCCILKQK